MSSTAGTSSSAVKKSQVLLMDGGMGTTLESLGYDVSSPLWGSELLQTNPQAIQSIHEGFLSAGSDLIETATYQLTLPGLLNHTKIPEREARAIMHSAVNVAYESLQSKGKPGGLVLALGPYGATLQPGQEYTGIYPRPYGPTPTSTNPNPSNAFSRFDLENLAEEYLAELHYDRLLIFALTREIWEKIEWIAFETIPLLREIKAVRRAMSMLDRRDPAKIQVAKKKFWISSAWPDGEHPQMKSKGGHVGVEEFMRACLADTSEYYYAPDVIGVNCTNPAYISQIAGECTTSLRQLVRAGSVRRRPGFVLYPDGGSIYDVNTRTWTERSTDPSSWAKSVMEVATDLAKSGEWDQVIVGGCCKAGFDEIKCLREELDEADIP